MDYNGKVLRDNNGGKHTLQGDCFSSGGEGEVYKLSLEPDYVAKIYYKKYRTDERHNKLKAMLLTDYNKLPECAWPVSILYDESGFCGFIMRNVSGYIGLIDFYVYDNRRKYSWAQYVTVAMNIAAVVSSLHELGHVVGDLNPNNILVDTKSCKVAFVDTDSYHIKSQQGKLFPCRVANPEFSAPELQGVDFNKTGGKPVFSANTDNFSLAVLLFRVLMNGVHPFACSSNTISVGEFQPVNNIKKGYCAYFNDTDMNGKLIHTPQSPPISILPSKIQMLFKQALLSSAYRPNGEQWYYELLSLRKNLCKCPADQSHEFYSNLEYCPWCYVKKEIARRMRELKNRTQNLANKTTNKNGNFESYNARYGTSSNTTQAQSSSGNNQSQTRSGVTPPNSAAFNKNTTRQSTNTSSSVNTAGVSSNVQPQNVSGQQDDSSGTGGYILGIIILGLIFLWDLPSTLDMISNNMTGDAFLVVLLEGVILITMIVLIRNYVKRKKGR